MPIGKLSKGKSFRGTLRYIWQKFDQKGEPRQTIELIAGSVRDRDPDAAARHFGLVRRTRPQRRDAVRHISVRCALEDRERFDSEVQAEIADRVAGRLGYDTWQAVSHGDHLHIVASLIRSDGSIADDSHNYRQVENELRQIRKEYDLREVDLSPAINPENPRGPKPGEDGYERRTGRKSEKQRLKSAIYTAAEQARGRDAQAFLDALEQQGVDVQARWTKGGTLQGYALALPGGEKGAMRASAIDRTMTVKGLQRSYGIDMASKTQEMPDEYRGAAPGARTAPGRDPKAADADRAAAAAVGRDWSGEPDRAAAGLFGQPDRDYEPDIEQRGPSGGRSFRERLRAAARLLTMRRRFSANAAPEDLPPSPGDDGPPSGAPGPGRP